MAFAGRPGATKRQKEQRRAEKRLKKEEKKRVRKAEKDDAPRGEGEEDPDIAGIVLGPQPPAE